MSGGETMSLVTRDAPVSSKRLWAGRIIRALPALLLLFSGTMKLLKVPDVIWAGLHLRDGRLSELIPVRG